MHNHARNLFSNYYFINHGVIGKKKKWEMSPLNISSNDSGWLGAESGNMLRR